MEENLGVETDPNEYYKESLVKKLQDSLMSRVDNSIVDSGKAAGLAEWAANKNKTDTVQL